MTMNTATKKAQKREAQKLISEMHQEPAQMPKKKAVKKVWVRPEPRREPSQISVEALTPGQRSMELSKGLYLVLGCLEGYTDGDAREILRNAAKLRGIEL
jgi:hypothetical protein